MTSTRLTQQTRSREWAAALRAATHRPHRPLLATRGTAPTPDERRIQHDTQYIHSVQSSHGTLAGSPPPGSASYETHSRTRVGGWVLRSGCADPFPARSCLGAPRPPKGGATAPPFGRPPPPRYRTRPVCRAESKAESPPSETKPCLPIPCESFAGRATRVRPCSPPLPPGPDPPSTRAVLAAPLGVTRDTRKGRTRAPLLTPRSARRTGHSHNTLG